MAHIIENVDDNQHQLLDLLKNQTSIVDSTVNIFNQSQTAMKQQIDRLNSHVIWLQSEVKDQKLKESFNALATQIILLINHYQKMQAALLDMIIDTHHGKLNPLLLTPQQLQRQLAIIKENLPPATQLPAVQNNLLLLYNLMVVKGYVTPNQLIFQITLPLLSMEIYELLQITPVPAKINNTFISVLPSTKYLVVNLHRDLYYPMTQQELEKCVPFKDTTMLCKPTRALHRRGSVTGACEISILSKVTTPHMCTFINQAEPNSWIPLYQPNRWIFVTTNPTTINVLCDHNMTQYNLNGSGTLELTSGCILRDRTTMIQAHNVYYSSASSSFIELPNIPEFIQSSGLNQTQEKQPAPEQIFLHNVTELKQGLEDLKTHQHFQKRSHYYDIHHFSIGYITLGIVLIIIIYIVLQRGRYKKEQTRRNHPSPAGRQHQHHNFEFTKEEQIS